MLKILTLPEFGCDDVCVLLRNTFFDHHSIGKSCNAFVKSFKPQVGYLAGARADFGSEVHIQG